MREKMLGRVLLSVFVAASLVSCTKIISKDKYIAAMESIGCKGMLSETGPEAEALFKEQGITYADIQNFRKKTKPQEMVPVVMEVAKRVSACHGVGQ